MAVNMFEEPVGKFEGGVCVCMALVGGVGTKLEEEGAVFVDLT